MGKRKVNLPPELPPDIDEEVLEVSEEDINFVKENRDFAGFLAELNTKSIYRHVSRVADHKEDDLEVLYEKRNRKAAVNKPKEEEGLPVDRVDALPIKTLDGELQYRAAKKSSSVDVPDNKEATSGKDNEDKALVRLTKTERRRKLKKIRREAKKQTKEQVKDESTLWKSAFRSPG